MSKNITIARLNTLVTANATQFSQEMDRAAAIAKTKGRSINTALSAIGSTLGGDIAGNAVIAKMIRVMLLVPFLLTLGLVLRGRGVSGAENKPQAKLPIPWFALAFVAMAGVNSLQILPAQVVDALRMAGMLLLTAAMASLGIDTTLARMRQAGIQPLLLGGGLFLHLIIIGGLVNWLAA